MDHFQQQTLSFPEGKPGPQGHGCPDNEDQEKKRPGGQDPSSSHLQEKNHQKTERSKSKAM